MDNSKIRYEDVQWQASYGHMWRSVRDDNLEGWLEESDIKHCREFNWQFRHKDTHELIPLDDFLEICRREVELEKNQQPAPEVEDWPDVRPSNGAKIVWDQGFGPVDHPLHPGPFTVFSTDSKGRMEFEEEPGKYWWWDGEGWSYAEEPNGVMDTLHAIHVALEEHPSGALRESKAGKGRPDLFLAGFPRAIMAVCRHMDCELGRQRNWEKGLPESSLISSQFRHLLGYASGVSEDTPAYNLTANVWNALVLLEEFLRVQDGVMDPSVLNVEKEKFDVQD